MGIYLKNGDKASTREELLSMLYGDVSEKAISKGAHTFTTVATYSNIECTYCQCLAGKLRSFDDIHILMNTYFPKTDIKTTFETIISFGKQYSEETKKCVSIQLGVCSTMGKLRVVPIKMTIPDTIEFVYFNTKMSHSPHTWEQILEISGFTKESAMAFRKEKLQIP